MDLRSAIMGNPRPRARPLLMVGVHHTIPRTEISEEDSANLIRGGFKDTVAQEPRTSKLHELFDVIAHPIQFAVWKFHVWMRSYNGTRAYLPLHGKLEGTSVRTPMPLPDFSDIGFQIAVIFASLSMRDEAGVSLVKLMEGTDTGDIEFCKQLRLHVDP